MKVFHAPFALAHRQSGVVNNRQIMIGEISMADISSKNMQAAISAYFFRHPRKAIIKLEQLYKEEEGESGKQLALQFLNVPGAMRAIIAFDEKAAVRLIKGQPAHAQRIIMTGDVEASLRRHGQDNAVKEIKAAWEAERPPERTQSNILGLART
jgi:hypothetical protein